MASEISLKLYIESLYNSCLHKLLNCQLVFPKKRYAKKKNKTTEIILFAFSFNALKGRLTVRDGS